MVVGGEAAVLHRSHEFRILNQIVLVPLASNNFLPLNSCLISKTSTDNGRDVVRRPVLHYTR